MTDQVRAAAGGNPAEFQGIALFFRSSKGEVKLGPLSLGVDREGFANLRAMLGQLTNVTEWEIEGDQTCSTNGLKLISSSVKAHRRRQLSHDCR